MFFHEHTVYNLYTISLIAGHALLWLVRRNCCANHDAMPAISQITNLIDDIKWWSNWRFRLVFPELASWLSLVTFQSVAGCCCCSIPSSLEWGNSIWCSLFEEKLSWAAFSLPYYLFTFRIYKTKIKKTQYNQFVISSSIHTLG